MTGPSMMSSISGASLGVSSNRFSSSHPGKQMRMEEAALRANFTGGNWAATGAQYRAGWHRDRCTIYYEPQQRHLDHRGLRSRGCGEQWLGPYENCCLGSVNLASTSPRTRRPPWWTGNCSALHLESTHFLDNVVSANAYVPAVPQVAEAAYAPAASAWASWAWGT